MSLDVYSDVVVGDIFKRKEVFTTVTRYHEKTGKPYKKTLLSLCIKTIAVI